jgi:hypothetical protein
VSHKPVTMVTIVRETRVSFSVYRCHVSVEERVNTMPALHIRGMQTSNIRGCSRCHAKQSNNPVKSRCNATANLASYSKVPGLNLQHILLCHNYLPSSAQVRHSSTKFESWLEYRKFKLSNFMEHGPYWEVNSFSDSQKIPWNQKLYYPVHKNPTHVPLLSQINPVLASILLLEDPF